MALNPIRAIRRRIIARAIRKTLRAYRFGMERQEDRDWSEEAENLQEAMRQVEVADASKRIVEHLRGASMFGGLVLNPPIPMPEPPPKPQPEPGRQNIRQTSEGSGMFGIAHAWEPTIPAHAKSIGWADIHRFPPGAPRQRDPRAPMEGHAPPIAMVCIGCELEQAPLTSGARSCPYCGLNIHVIGPVAMWWRQPVTVPEWKG